MYEVKGEYTSAKIFTELENIEVTLQTLAICNHPIFKDCDIRIMPDCHRGKVALLVLHQQCQKAERLFLISLELTNLVECLL